MYLARNIRPANARNARFTVQLEPYSLEPGHVGRSVFQAVVMSRHKSAAAASRALVKLICGTDNGAREYLRAIGPGVALRYVARETVAPYRAYSAAALRDIARPA
jgi:hypothetical protein